MSLCNITSICYIEFTFWLAFSSCLLTSLHIVSKENLYVSSLQRFSKTIIMIICSCFSFLSLSHLFCFNRKKTVLCYSLNQKNLVHHQRTYRPPLGQQIRYNITTYQFIQYLIKQKQQYIPEVHKASGYQYHNNPLISEQ